MPALSPLYDFLSEWVPLTYYRFMPHTPKVPIYIHTCLKLPYTQRTITVPSRTYRYTGTSGDGRTTCRIPHLGALWTCRPIPHPLPRVSSCMPLCAYCTGLRTAPPAYYISTIPPWWNITRRAALRLRDYREHHAAYPLQHHRCAQGSPAIPRLNSLLFLLTGVHCVPFTGMQQNNACHDMPGPHLPLGCCLLPLLTLRALSRGSGLAHTVCWIKPPPARTYF